VSNAWFALNFRTFLIRATLGLPDATHHAVVATIDRLGLNSDNDYVRERIEVLRSYALGSMSFDQLRAKYPFLAHQVENQDFDRLHLPRLRAYFRRR
jgi:hypothetical protein